MNTFKKVCSYFEGVLLQRHFSRHSYQESVTLKQKRLTLNKPFMQKRGFFLLLLELNYRGLINFSKFKSARDLVKVPTAMFTVCFIIVPELVSQRFHSPLCLHACKQRKTYFPQALSSANNHLFSNPLYCVDSRGEGEKVQRAEKPSWASCSLSSTSRGSGGQSHNLAEANIIWFTSSMNKRESSEAILTSGFIKMNKGWSWNKFKTGLQKEQVVEEMRKWKC